jgi:isovaleryl-CoA dehydrogenase
MNERLSADTGVHAGNAFDLTPDQKLILDEADKFSRKELYPLAARMDNEEWWPEDVFRKIGEQGYFGLTVPEKFGGVGLDFFTSGLVSQAMARWN